MSYEQFGKLRFLNFFSKTDDYYDDDSGLENLPRLGMACSEGIGPYTYFANYEDAEETVSIGLDFEKGCPAEEGNRLLHYLGLPISKGASYLEVKKLLGEPQEDLGGAPSGDDMTELRYVVGSRWPYYVYVQVRDSGGVFNIWICRKDYADRYDEWVSNL